jgi:apolipoprotein N-acyltransferase
LLWGILALVCSSLALGRFLFAPAVWLAPVFLVRFVRTAPGKWALPGFVLLHTLALEIALLGTVPLPLFAHIGLFTGLSLVLGLVFLADRWIVDRFDSMLTTLTVPCGWAAYDFLTGRFSPNGTWGSIAYSLTEQLPVVQIASIGGWVLLTFLVAWIGTIVNRIWEARLAGREIRRDLIVAAVVLGSVLGFGIVRLSMSEPGRTNRVALLAAEDTFQGEHLEEVWLYTRGLDLSAEQLDAARGQIADWQDRHFDMLEQALADGAAIAIWAEVNAAMTEAELPGWLERASRAARTHSSYVGLGLAVFGAARGAPTQNRFALFGPDGRQVWDYYKSTRVPGDHQVLGDGMLPRADSDLGRLTGAICFDLDFPYLIRQAGAMDADMLIAPSNDWTEARWIHARMAVMRAVEQGFNLVRPTKDGISLVSDAFARVLARLDTDTGPSTVLLAEVPSRGVTTLYSRTGDAVGWLSVVGFVVLLGYFRR